MATNLEVGKYKNIGERTCVAPSLNFVFVPSSRNKHAVVKCCTQLGQVGKWSEVGVGGGGMGPAENASSSFAAFCDSRKTIKKMAQPSPPCLKPSLHNSGSQRGGGFYGYRLKFWLFFGYRLIFCSYG